MWFIEYLALWSLTGAFLFSVFVVVVFRSGVVYTSRKEDGTLKEKVPIRGYLTMAAFLLVIVGFLVLANYLSLARANISLGFGGLFLLNFTLYLILFLFDTLVIDWLVLAYWRPGFLKLSDQMGRESMREHITRSIPMGTGFGLLISSLSTVISFFAFMR